MADRNQESHSHLFTLRIWAETMGGDQEEWRGKLKYVPSGESRYFREWEMLIELLKDHLDRA